MKKNPLYKKERLSFFRKAVIASATITKNTNTIHSLTEIDISLPKKYIKNFLETKGIKLSFTGYILCCLTRTVNKHKQVNSFISGNKYIKITNINISVLIEKEINGEIVPEPLAISKCEELNCLQVTEIIRNAQKNKTEKLGSYGNMRWFTLIPGCLLKAFIKLANKNIHMGVKYGKLAITAVGMYSQEPVWFIPHGSPTILLTIGSIVNRIVEKNGKIENCEHLCLTVSFDHNIVDGAPAARFMNDLIQEIKSGHSIIEIL